MDKELPKLKPFNPIVKLTAAFRLKVVDYKWQITIKFENLKNEGIERDPRTQTFSLGDQEQSQPFQS